MPRRIAVVLGLALLMCGVALANAPPGYAIEVEPAIAAGSFHTCALLSDGSVKCWGNNDWGQLGDGSKIHSSTPVEVSGLSDAVAIAAGSFHTCALLTDETVQCWGKNDWGQLGDGTTAQSTTPVPVSGLTGADAISAGGFHTCALLTDETVKCWGYNFYGQLGNGTTADSATPATVSGLTGAVPTAVSAGGFHTCVRLDDNTARCWGFNDWGGLGDNSTAQRTIPVAVSGLTGAAAVSSGGYHTCALPAAPGDAQCWGYNFYGQLGNNTTADSTAPVVVPGLSGAAAVSGGGFHTCALLNGGGVQCWGNNDLGQLGDGSTAQRTTPVAVPKLSDATAVSAGAFHTCALLSGESAKCWGYNFYGQLGNGTKKDSAAPVHVLGLFDHIEAVSATIGTGGGDLDTGSKDPVEAQLSVPPGALSGDTEVTIDVHETSEVDLPPGGGSYLSRAFDLGPDGTILDPPAMLTLTYTDAEVAGLNEEELGVWLFDSIAGEWELADVISRDVEANSLTIQIDHFSMATVRDLGTSDFDADYCPDAAEIGPDETAGGRRDPTNPWDYFNPTYDGQNRVDDILAVADHFFVSEGQPGYEDGRYDRSGIPETEAEPWRLGPPNGRVLIEDVLAAVNSYFHDCGTGIPEPGL